AAVLAFDLWSQADGLAQANIHVHLSGASGVVDGDNRHAGLLRGAKGPIRTGDDARPNASGKKGTIVIDGITVQVAAGGDVKRRAGAEDDERRHAHTPGQRDGAAEKRAMADIKRRAAVVSTQIVLI